MILQKLAKRPRFVHFLAVVTDDFLNVKAAATVGDKGLPNAPPIRGIGLLASRRFRIKLEGLGSDGKPAYQNVFESDGRGGFDFKVPLNPERKRIRSLRVYEVRHTPGLEWHLGSFIPLRITSPKRIVISDFDKTLVDTRYSTPREVYSSLTKPLGDFPTLKESLSLLRECIDKGLHPFILSSAPHFYENAIQDWLYRNRIYTADLFLKDYRQLFSLGESLLSPKDIKIQGAYKINQLLHILLTTGVPDELVLIGDDHESDPVVYAALVLLLRREGRAWDLWQMLKKHPSFKSNPRQEGGILNKFYQLEELLKRRGENESPPDIRVAIRKLNPDSEFDFPTSFKAALPFVEFYSEG